MVLIKAKSRYNLLKLILKRYFMIKDLEIIDKLIYAGILLEKEESIFGINRENSYFLQNGLITGLLIKDIKIDEKILHIISKLKNLKYLYLSKNQITKIPKSFAKLIYLEELDLSNNKLTNLPTYFSNFIHLKWLNLKSNAITQIPDEFSSLVNIKKLDISDTPMIKIPEVFYSIPNISIELDNTPIKRTNEYLSNLANKENITLCYKQEEYLYEPSDLQLDSLDEIELESIHQSLYNIPLSGTTLETSPNSVQEIYESIFTPIDINYSDTNQNEIHEIYNLLADIKNNNPHFEKVSNIVTLKSLDLSYTNLQEIPTYLSQLTHLEWLDLSYTNITHIPESICKLQNLQQLDLRGNNIRTIPISILKLKKLETLILDDNQISNIPLFIHEMDNLRNLYLNKNKITKIPKSLKDMKHLKEIDLRNNHIIYISSSLSHIKIKI